MSEESKVYPITLTIVSDPKQVCVARAAAEAFAAREGFTKEGVEQIGLALNEALANIIKHAYRGETDRPVVVTMDTVTLDADRCVRIRIRDFGGHVDPATIKGRNLDDVRPGGLGVHIIRTVMDQVEYCSRPEGGTDLLMLKRLHSVKGVGV